MNHSRLKLVIIFAAFLVPLLAAFIWYYGLDGDFVPSARTNHAPLLTPPVVIQPFSNRNIDGALFDVESLRHRWSVIHVVAKGCGTLCQQSLYNTRQVRLALNKDINRLQRILLYADRDVAKRLKAAHPDALWWLPASDGIEKQIAPIMQRQNHGEHKALLVDPLGNIMLVIPAKLDPRLLLKDLKHLLRVSRIG